MLENIKGIFHDAGDGIKETGKNLAEKINPFDDITEAWQNFTHDVLLKIVIIVIAIVLITTLFDFVKRAIRGLDVAALGGLFCWGGSKVPNVILLRDLIKPMYTIGIVLIIVGVLIFVLFKAAAISKKKRAKAKLKAEIDAGK